MEGRYHLLSDYSGVADSRSGYPSLEDPREVEMSRVTPEVKQPAGVIECAGCKMRLGFPRGATVVKCPKCSSITATESISRTRCPFCTLEVMYPSKETVLACICGMSFRVG